MKQIFKFIDVNRLYKNCVLASVAHSIMVGEYGFLSSEQSWDENNYNFQDMEGGRGTISFSDNYFVCVIKKNINYQNYNKNIICDLLHGAAKKYVDLAHREALQYVLEEINGEIIPVVSLIFWGDKDKIWANLSQDEIFDLADNMLKPILYDEDKAIDYWKNYYEMSLEQIELLKKIYFKRLNNTGKIFLNNEIKKILMDWFEDIDECIESFQEINIFFIEE